MQMLSSTLTSLHREDIPYTIASRGLVGLHPGVLHFTKNLQVLN